MSKKRSQPTPKQRLALKKIRRSALRMRKAERAAQVERVVLYATLRMARDVQIPVKTLAQASGWTGPRITQITKEKTA